MFIDPALQNLAELQILVRKMKLLMAMQFLFLNMLKTFLKPVLNPFITAKISAFLDSSARPGKKISVTQLIEDQ